MFERVFDNRLFRIVVGAAIGIPLSAAAVVAGFEAILLSLGGVLNVDYNAALLGPGAVFGLLGIAGAWRRLVRKNSEMKPRERTIVRLLLYGGLVASLTLIGVSFSYLNSWELAMFFAGVTVAGIAFILATPQRSAA